MNLSKEVKVVRVMTAQAAGTTLLHSDSVDMQGYDAVEFVAMFGTIAATAVTSIKAAQSDDDSTFADLAGTGVSVADTDDNKVAVLDIERPQKRYVRCDVSRATANATVDGVLAILYKGRLQPSALDSTVAAAEHHVSPAEGTA